jgi:phosphoenolpyruvate-protein kinase (PTS system EI component)
MDRVLSTAREAKMPCTVCGEMAGSPFYVPVLIGLGAVELSMNSASIGRISRLIAGISYKEAAELVAAIGSLRTSAEIEAALFSELRRRWPQLYDRLPGEQAT